VGGENGEIKWVIERVYTSSYRVQNELEIRRVGSTLKGKVR
jgi:hypothetical protein